jgi:hypothetical protein
MVRFYQKKQKSHTSAKVRRFSIPIPSMSMRPISISKTLLRWKNDACGSVDVDIDHHLDKGVNVRRVSIDHTSPSHDSASSLTGAYSPDSCVTYNIAHDHDEAHNVDTAVPIKPRSLSKPMSLYQPYQPGASTPYPCLEDMPPNALERPALYYSANTSQSITSTMAPLQLPTSHSIPVQSIIQPSSSNSALQARIEAIRIQQQYVGDNHPDVIFALSTLAKVQERLGNHVEAAAIRNESQMRMTLAKYAPVHPMFRDE